MRIEDNGSGMGRDDALLALERHATSKIAEAADLDRLASYGFRGEALPSIASVSRFELQTRAEGQDTGTEILVNGGKFVHVRDCGRPVGTRIEVTHLFNSVPARRKFLKTDQTESAHIIQCVRLYALACPQVSFSLIEDGRVIFRSPQCSTLAERVGEIFGRQTAAALVPLEAAEAGMRLGGLIGRPGTGRATRHEMIVFVNQRPVDSRTLNYALIESYHESLPKGRYPLAFVFFECDPAAVDVNVHPAKREVRFRSEPAVRSFVIRAVLARLRELGTTGGPTEDTGSATAPAATLASPPSAPVPPSRSLTPSGAISPAVRPTPINWPSVAPLGAGGQVERRDFATAGRSALPAVNQTPIAPAAGAPASAPGSGSVARWRLVGLAHGHYALFETAAGLVLLDRRAAHERVWFEELQAQFRTGSVPSQRLLLPVPVELDPIAAALLLDRRSLLHDCGFEVAEFGRNFFRIEAIPAWLEPGGAEPFLRDFLGLVREGRLAGATPDLAREEVARLATAKALRLPENPGEVELQALAARLFATTHPLTNPAGRPTCIEISHGELARRFQK
jgi:DNA mismatch repair protein MutL